MLWKFLDLGWGVAAVVLGAGGIAAAGAWAAVGERARATRGHGPAIGASILVFALVVSVCAGMMDRVGRAPDRVFLVEREGALRLGSLTTRTGKGGSSCGIRVYELDGSYVGGSAHGGSCEPRFVGGSLVLRTPPGLIFDGDHVAVDAWTGRMRDRLSDRMPTDLPGRGEFRVERVTGAGVALRLQDGSVREVPLDGGDAQVTLAEREGAGFGRPDLHQAYQVSTDCAGPWVPVLLHRSVAFGEGAWRLSALNCGDPDCDAGVAAPRWTVDLGAHHGDRDVLSVFGAGGRCYAVAGLPGGRLAVVAVDGASGDIMASWAN